jgi:hypothetical protein
MYSENCKEVFRFVGLVQCRLQNKELLHDVMNQVFATDKNRILVLVLVLLLVLVVLLLLLTFGLCPKSKSPARRSWQTTNFKVDFPSGTSFSSQDFSRLYTCIYNPAATSAPFIGNPL